MDTRLPDPHDIRHRGDPEPARHDSAIKSSLLTNLTLSIGNLRLRCEFGIERVENPNSATPGAEGRPGIGRRLRRVLRPEMSGNPRRPHPDLEATSHQGQANRSNAVIPRHHNLPGIVFWEAPNLADREASHVAPLSGMACAGDSTGSLADRAVSADWPHRHRFVASIERRPQPLNGENCTIILSDVAGFGAHSRTDEDRRIIREALFSITHGVLRGIPDVWSWDDRGDGLLTVVPPSVPTAQVIEQLHKSLPLALDEHNHTYHDSAQIQLRVAINVGPVATDSMGVSGEAIIVTARLLEAPLFKKAMNTCGASLGVIASTFIYETVIRHGHTRAGYSNVQVDVKETNVAAWMKLFETAVSLPGVSNPSVAS